MPLESGIEVDARNAANVLAAFRLVPAIAYRILAKHGLGQATAHGTFVPDRRPWWPIEHYLAALTEISEAVGPGKMLEIGKLVHEHAVLPPALRDIDSAFRALDAAYHLNHRKDGAVMLDLATGRM